MREPQLIVVPINQPENTSGPCANAGRGRRRKPADKRRTILALLTLAAAVAQYGCAFGRESQVNINWKSNQGAPHAKVEQTTDVAAEGIPPP